MEQQKGHALGVTACTIKKKFEKFDSKFFKRITLGEKKDIKKNCKFLGVVNFGIKRSSVKHIKTNPKLI